MRSRDDGAAGPYQYSVEPDQAQLDPGPALLDALRHKPRCRTATDPVRGLARHLSTATPRRLRSTPAGRRCALSAYGRADLHIFTTEP